MSSCPGLSGVRAFSIIARSNHTEDFCAHPWQVKQTVVKPVIVPIPVPKLKPEFPKSEFPKVLFKGLAKGLKNLAEDLNDNEDTEDTDVPAAATSAPVPVPSAPAEQVFPSVSALAKVHASYCAITGVICAIYRMAYRTAVVWSKTVFRLHSTMLADLCCSSGLFN